MSAVTITGLHSLKHSKTRFACVTAYDAGFARLAEQAGIEVILIGDSLGMVVHGHTSTVLVTVDHMRYHTHMVNSGSNKAYLIADMPFASYATKRDALANAKVLMQAGAHMVKLEGGKHLCEIITHLVQQGIPVCAHIGLTPQSVHVLGGYKVQGREENQAALLSEASQTLQDAGAQLLVMECMPETLAKHIDQQLDIPTIGIGAGRYTTAQVLVMQDLLGMTETPPRFVKNFLTQTNSIQEALSAYATAVKEGHFPADEHCFQ